ncbi:transcriptional regulator [Vibrio parahaemolyticus]|nr:transcriptional regulator [Vibrio parahaemolyticus]EHW0649577.1 transcriptional regulator [Vibrio parahaemolyticus]EIU7055738.1 transcriptional regulator [Vibrio parahaemolyticus]EIV1708931.1 transcriptional regulator [Vibrio parahaemolyticus]EKK9974021.1 transcriptional regulator [Vibrio parahaemolyticus]MCG0029777.1 transcriptional regulator [Vibrio parahaemolyticus]
MDKEKEVEERLGDFYIPIWDGCDKSVAAAVHQFREKWHSYSELSKSHNIISLIKELIDPATCEFIDKIPADYLELLPIYPPQCSYSDLIKFGGFRYTVDQIHHYLRNFVDNSSYTEQRNLYISTQETLKNLFSLCEGKRPKRSNLTPDIYLNTERRRSFCAFCGNPTEFSLFMTKWVEGQFLENEEDAEGKKKRAVLSHTYCLNHKPKLQDGSWNSMYKQAKRSSKQFDQEVLRLRRQVAQPGRHNAMSGDKLIDEYFYYYLQDKTIKPEQSDALFEYVRTTYSNPVTLDKSSYEKLLAIANQLTAVGSALGPDDEGALRNIARRIVDSRLTDNKKRMLALRKQGLSQEEIAQKLTHLGGKKISHQAVSKALGTIRDEFLLPRWKN